MRHETAGNKDAIVRCEVANTRNVFTGTFLFFYSEADIAAFYLKKRALEVSTSLTFWQIITAPALMCPPPLYFFQIISTVLHRMVRI